MAKEDTDRCYHSTAVLLPDGRVLSAGGGEYRPDSVNDNPLDQSHSDGQIYSPPYLCQGGQRPDIMKAPDKVGYGQTFDVGTSNPGQIDMVTWVRLSSVTHSFNANQRINFLTFVRNAKTLTVTAPPKANVCPPGHYMLFVLDKNKIPSIAKIINIQ
jgi:hypothetical protein